MNVFALLLGYIVFFCSYGQENGITIKFEVKRGESVRTASLTYSEGRSIFLVHPYKPSAASSSSEIQLTVDSSRLEFNFLDFSDGTMKSSEYLKNNDRVLVNDLIPQFDWQITSETKKIGRFVCKKAKTEFRCSEYTAWFAPEIPISVGPWKLTGLPGAILELNNDTVGENHRATAIEYPANVESTKDPSIGAKFKMIYRTFGDFAKDQRREAEKLKTFLRAQNNLPDDAEIFIEERECY